MTTVRGAVRAGVELSDETRSGDRYLVERDDEGDPTGWIRSDTVLCLDAWM